MPPQDPELAHWFSQTMQPYEPMLRAWLRNRFPAEGDIDDIIQEAYLRVLEARKTSAINSPKAFLFATARNLALARLRRQEVVSEKPLAEMDALAILDETADVHQQVARAQELEMLTQAIQSLPTRCRQILTLRKIYGLSQKEVAQQLGISEHTVEAQGTIGFHKIAKHLKRLRDEAGSHHE